MTDARNAERSEAQRRLAQHVRLRPEVLARLSVAEINALVADAEAGQARYRAMGFDDAAEAGAARA